MSALTLNLGRNKRSAVLDGDEAEDHERLAEIVATCDVIITNLRPGSRRRLGLDWDEVHRANPAAVMCTAQAFAGESETGEEPAYDDVIQAVSGMPDLYRRAFGTPQFSPSVLADKICGLVIVGSVLAALHSQAVRGEGQWVDVTGPASSVPPEGLISPRTLGSPIAVLGTRTSSSASRLTSQQRQATEQHYGPLGPHAVELTDAVSVTMDDGVDAREPQSARRLVQQSPQQQSEQQSRSSWRR